MSGNNPVDLDLLAKNIEDAKNRGHKTVYELERERKQREAAQKKQNDEQRAIEQMRRKAQERLDRVARDGYKAKSRGQSINLNPYSKDTQSHLHAAWKAGFEYEPGTEQPEDGSADTV